MGWVDREGGVIELLDRSSTEAGVYATIACEDAAEVAQALIAALPPLEESPDSGDSDAGGAVGD